MDQQLVDEILTGDSDEIADLKANLNVLEGFLDLVREIDALPDLKKRFYEESRSLYQTTATGLDIAQLETVLSKFFGAPVKPADKSLPRKLRKSLVVKYLGGIQKDQSLFSMDLQTGQFYGALWPWRRNKTKIEIHLGYCSDWMTDEDYSQLETLVKRCVSRDAFDQMNTDIGGRIHGISLPSFLQMAEMEKSSFTLRVTSRHGVGELHLSEGDLLTADFEEYTGFDAACRIVSWDDVSIDIEPLNTSKPHDIKMPLMHVLMESLKLKDEAALPREEPSFQPKGRPQKKRPGAKGEPPKRLVRLQRAPVPVSPRKRTRVITMMAIGVGAFAILAAVALAVFYVMDNRRISESYHGFIAQVEKTKSLEHKMDQLNTYLEDNPKSPYGSMIQSRIRDIKQQIEDHDFEQATLTVNGLSVDETYEAKAIKIFSLFLEKYPNSRHTEKINQSIAEIKDLLDQYYYEELKRAARLDFSGRLNTYRQYLSQFPNGKYRHDVELLINQMGEKYLSYLHDEAEQCEKDKRWDTCIEHCNNFVRAYAGLGLSQKAIELKTRLEDNRDYFELLSRTADAGTDFQKAYRHLNRYLAENPETSQREKIEEAMARLSEKVKVQRQWLAVKAYAANSKNSLGARIKKVDRYVRKNINGAYSRDARSLLETLEQERKITVRRQQIEARKQSELARMQAQREEQEKRKRRVIQQQAVMESKIRDSSRYRSNGDGTFKDLSTGLTWAILDSYQELNGCLTYDQALKYLQTLSYGGHRSWRLPTANELAAIIKKGPYFPASGAKWYWSAETGVKGYHSVADIVTARHESVFRRDQRALTECGSVRAIRVTP